jgi:glucose-6-phosphate dehydrogenase assembly protein OpcA
VTTLWDTTGRDVVKALATERRSAGAVASGLALTLVVVVGESQMGPAETAAAQASSTHPCRVLVVVRRQLDASSPRLDAEVTIGGRHGPGETVVMRMYGRLGLHAESVVLPLLAPDAPVVTWWHGPPPRRIANDPLGVFADRRITDCAAAEDGVGALAQRAEDFAPGDTDLSWTRATGWRSILASAFDSIDRTATGATVTARAGDPTGALLSGWLRSRLGVEVSAEQGRGPGVSAVRISLEGGDLDGGADGDGGSEPVLEVVRSDARSATLRRPGAPDRQMPLPTREDGDLLAEELRRLDADAPYAEALGCATGYPDLGSRSPLRTHEWHDPAAS